MKEYETSLKTILDEERQEYENLLTNCTNLIEKILDEEYESNEDKNKVEYRIANVLFAFKSSKIDVDELIKIDNMKNNRFSIDKFNLQRTIKNYLCNIDSTLDYLGKLINDLKGKGIHFDRKLNGFANRINYQRNQVIHESVPTIIFREGNRNHSYTPCHADFAGSYDSYENHTEIYILFNEDISNCKEYTIRHFINTTYYETKNEIERIISELIKLL